MRFHKLLSEKTMLEKNKTSVRLERNIHFVPQVDCINYKSFKSSKTMTDHNAA